MTSIESRIAVLQTDIAKLGGQIAAVQAKIDKLTARRQKLDQRQKALHGKLYSLVEAHCLADQKARFAAEPAERTRFLAGIGKVLTESQTVHFMRPPENGGGNAEPGAQATAEAPASDEPAPESQASQLTGEDEQTPATRKPSTSATTRPTHQARPASEKQLKYLRDLIHKNPAVAEKHNIVEANLGSMTQAEASAAIKVLRPVSRSAS